MTTGSYVNESQINISLLEMIAPYPRFVVSYDLGQKRSPPLFKSSIAVNHATLKRKVCTYGN